MALQLVFWSCALLIIFTYLGYPLALVLLAPLRRRPVMRPEPFEPSISLVIAARNEEKHLRAKLENCTELDYPRDKIEVIVVDDGSEDSTGDVLRAFCEERVRRGDAMPPVRVTRQKISRGKAAALNMGVAMASGDLIVFSDADSLISRHSLRLLVQPFSNPIVGCVAGRYFPGGVTGRNAQGVGLYWKYENYLRRKESQVGGILGASGSLYAIRREAYPTLPDGVINDDFIIPMRMTEQGYRCLYEPRATAVEDESGNETLEFSRRVRIMAGNCEHLWMFRSLLGNWRRWRTVFQLICHKLLRVLSPWFVIGLVASSIGLVATHPVTVEGVLQWSGLFYHIAFALLLLLFICAALGYWGRGRAFKLVYLSWYFLMLNVAALAGTYYFACNRKGLRWGRLKKETARDEDVYAGQEAKL